METVTSVAARVLHVQADHVQQAQARVHLAQQAQVRVLHVRAHAQATTHSLTSRVRVVQSVPVVRSAASVQQTHAMQKTARPKHVPVDHVQADHVQQAQARVDHVQADHVQTQA